MYSSSITPEYEAANEQYATDFDKGDLALPPSRYVTGNKSKELLTDCQPIEK
jgi:hypothetical protein